MKKLMLDPDALRVETFATDELTAGRGTVAGAAAWRATGTAKPDCDDSGIESCDYSWCGDNTCNTCDADTYCGSSCIFVCDAEAVDQAGTA